MADNSKIVAPEPISAGFDYFNYTPIVNDGGYGPDYAKAVAYIDVNGNVWDRVPYDTGDGYSKPNLLLSAEFGNDPLILATRLMDTDLGAVIELSKLKESNPKEYYTQVAGKLEDKIYNDWKYNASNPTTEVATQQLERLKEIAPDAYYTAKLTDLGRSVGWQLGQNREDRTAPLIESIKGMIPDAMKAGLTPEQIDSIVGSNTNFASAQNQRRIASDAAMGGPGAFTGALPVLGLAALAAATGGIGAGAAGATGAGAGAAAGGLDAYMASAGLAPGLFEGAAFTMPSTLGVAGAAELAGPTYGELGYTGLAEGAMGPTYAEMGYTGLNNAEAIAAAEAASKGLTGAEALKYINQARQGLGLASNLAKLLGGVAGMGGSGNVSTGGLDLSKLANALRPTDTFNAMNLQQIQPKSPFFGSNQGTLSGEDIYDVSGSNLANALRKT